MTENVIVTNVMNEPFDLSLHAPVAELDAAQLVGTHQLLVFVRRVRNRRRVHLTPVLGQRPSSGLLRLEQRRILLREVISTRDGIGDDVQKIFDEKK